MSKWKKNEDVFGNKIKKKNKKFDQWDFTAEDQREFIEEDKPLLIPGADEVKYKRAKDKKTGIEMELYNEIFDNAAPNIKSYGEQMLKKSERKAKRLERKMRRDESIDMEEAIANAEAEETSDVLKEDVEEKYLTQSPYIHIVEGYMPNSFELRDGKSSLHINLYNVLWNDENKEDEVNTAWLNNFGDEAAGEEFVRTIYTNLVTTCYPTAVFTKDEFEKLIDMGGYFKIHPVADFVFMDFSDYILAYYVSKVSFNEFFKDVVQFVHESSFIEPDEENEWVTRIMMSILNMTQKYSFLASETIVLDDEYYAGDMSRSLIEFIHNDKCSGSFTPETFAWFFNTFTVPEPDPTDGNGYRKITDMIHDSVELYDRYDTLSSNVFIEEEDEEAEKESLLSDIQSMVFGNTNLATEDEDYEEPEEFDMEDVQSPLDDDEPSEEEVAHDEETDVDPVDASDTDIDSLLDASEEETDEETVSDVIPNVATMSVEDIAGVTSEEAAKAIQSEFDEKLEKTEEEERQAEAKKKTASGNFTIPVIRK